MEQDEIEQGIKRAKEWLLCYKKKHGVWRDFLIEEPGISDQWVSDYVGNCLLDSEQLEVEVRKELDDMADFLIRTRKQDGGW